MKSENVTLKDSVVNLQANLAQSQDAVTNSLAEIECLKDSLGSNYEQLTESLEELASSDERCKGLNASIQSISAKFEACRVEFDETRTQLRQV
jgi:uncharacterized coiled-coil DUF342 family protein